MACLHLVRAILELGYTASLLSPLAMCLSTHLIKLCFLSKSVADMGENVIEFEEAVADCVYQFLAKQTHKVKVSLDLDFKDVRLVIRGRITLCNPVQNCAIQSSPVQSSPVQSSPVQSSPVQSSPVQSRVQVLQ